MSTASRILVTGVYGGAPPFGLMPAQGSLDGFSAELDVSGNQQWSQSYGASGASINNLIPELGPSGELVVSSTFTGSLPLAGVTEVSSNGGSSAAALLLKHDPAGNLLWSRSFPVLTQSTYGYRAVVAPNDDVVLVGEHRETVDMGDKLLTFVGQGDGFVVRMQP